MLVEILWDIDGTLIFSDNTDKYLYEEAVQSILGINHSSVEVQRHGKTDYQIISEYLKVYGANVSYAEKIQEALEELSQETYTPARNPKILLPGVIEILEYTSQTGCRNTLLTGNSKKRAITKITSARLDKEYFDWDRGLFGDKTINRFDLAEQAASRAKEPKCIPVIVGDTPNDSAAAAHAGLHFCGIATGPYPIKMLEETQYTLLLPDLLSGFDKFVSLLEQLREER